MATDSPQYPRLNMDRNTAQATAPEQPIEQAARVYAAAKLNLNERREDATAASQRLEQAVADEQNAWNDLESMAGRSQPTPITANAIGASFRPGAPPLHR